MIPAPRVRIPAGRTHARRHGCTLVRFMVLPMKERHDNVFYCGSANNG